MPHTNTRTTTPRAEGERAGRLGRACLAVRSNAAREIRGGFSAGLTALTTAHTGVKPQVRGLRLDMASRGLVLGAQGWGGRHD